MTSRRSGVAVVTVGAELAGLHADWERLFHAADPRTVFVHPDWVRTWIRRFVAEDDVHVVTVWRDGELVAVAPFHRRHLGPGVSQLQLVGAGKHVCLTELPGILVHPEWRRSAMRAVFDHLATLENSAWSEITLGPGDGWIEPPAAAGSSPSAYLKSGLPCLVVPLDDDWETTRRRLKRNIREAIRRGTNRLARDGLPWKVSVAEGGDVPVALVTLAALHRARSLASRGPHHPDRLADPAVFGFLLEAAASLTSSGLVAVALLEVQGVPIAGQLVYRTPRRAYLGFSGLDPSWWWYCPGTLLTSECLRWASTAGCSEVNFSTGVDRSKWRWGESVEVWNEFAIVRDSVRARAAFSSYWRLRGANLDRRLLFGGGY